MRCPYCDRRLSMLGMKCRACRRYVLGWAHIFVLAVLAIAALLLMIKLIERISR